MKKFLSLVLTLAMILSLVTVPAMADEGDVTGVTLNKSTATLYVGATETLTATVEPAEATNKNVTWSSDNEEVATVANGVVTAVAAGTATITVTTTDQSKTATCTVTVNDKYELTVTADKTTLYSDATTDAAKTATLTPTLQKNGETLTEGVTYSYASNAPTIATAANSGEDPSKGVVIAVSAGSAKITATATVGGVAVATKDVTFTVASRYSVDAAAKTLEVYAGGTATLSQAKLEDALGGTVPEYTVSYAMKTDADKEYATVDATTGVVTGVKETTGSTTAKVVATVKEKATPANEYTLEYAVTVKPVTLVVMLTGVKNGSKNAITASALKSAVLTAVKAKLPNTTLTSNGLTSLKVTANNKSAGKLYNNTTALDANGELLPSSGTIYFDATEGVIGEAVFDITAAYGTTATYTGTLTIPVLTAGTINKSVVAVESGSSYVFDVDDVDDDLDCLYYKTTSTSNYNGTFDGNSESGWTLADDDDTITLAANKFTNGKCTLYVVGLYDDVAYTGTVTVEQETYEIDYTGVVDEKVYFSQDDFEDIFEEMADDAGDVSTGGTLTFDYVTFSVPSGAKGALYDNGTKITKSSTKCKDMDDVYYLTSKTETVSIRFTVYGEAKKTKNASAKDVDYDGVVNITVYDDGDITYEVDAGEFLEFDEDDFIDFYKDEKSGTLYSVTFGEPSKGTLYASYTSSKKNTDAADNTFYTDAKAGKDDYEIDDVLYLAETKPLTEYSVYIPFEAKGSKTSVSGTVEIIVNGKMPFTDVAEGSTFYDYIKYCYRNNIMQGKTTTLFKPAEPVTRAQFITTLYRMANSPTTYNSQAMSFTDCKNLSTEFQNAIKWGVAKKLINGYGNEFRPTASITRQAMVTILYRFGNNLGYIDGSDVLGNVNKFSDANKIAANMKEAVAWAVGAGLVSGNNGKFNPTGTTTRGACAKVLANFHETYVG